MACIVECMSKPDFSKGITITEAKMTRDLEEKAERIQEFMAEETNNRKTGKSNTGKMALILASRYLDNLEEEIENKREDMAKYYRKVDKLVEEIR